MEKEALLPPYKSWLTPLTIDRVNEEYNIRICFQFQQKYFSRIIYSFVSSHTSKQLQHEIKKLTKRKLANKTEAWFYYRFIYEIESFYNGDTIKNLLDISEGTLAVYIDEIVENIREWTEGVDSIIDTSAVSCINQI